MHESVIPEFDDGQVTLKGLSPQTSRILLIGGVVVLGLALILGWTKDDALKYFFHAYLVSFCFYLSLCLGALFFVALQHASRAGWSIAVRRVSEILAANILLMAVLFLPILLPLMFGSTALYEWLDAAKVNGDHVLEGKRAYLNLPFFTLRALVYFGIWGFLVWFFLRRSLEQDASGDANLSLRMERVSYPALVLFALTTTFAAFDWMMSLTPHWFSTIYGVYYFGGSVVGFFASDHPGPNDPAIDRPHEVGDHGRALPRVGEIPPGVCGLLGLHRLFAVHADLVRKYPRGNDLVFAATAGHLDDRVHHPVVWPPADSVLWAHVPARETAKGATRLLGGLAVSHALGRHLLPGDAASRCRGFAAGIDRHLLCGGDGTGFPGWSDVACR